MGGMMQGTGEGVKSLYGLPIDLKEHYSNYLFYMEIVRMHGQMPEIIQKNVEARLSGESLDALEWARDLE